MKLETQVIHAGGESDPKTGAIMPPIYMTSTFEQDAPGECRGYEYTRAGNPNFTILESVLAAIEEAKYATALSSGLGALTSLVSQLSTGDRVVALHGLYGGTYRLFHKVFNRYGVECLTPPLSDAKTLEALFIKKKPKWLFFETPTNPLLDIYDISALARLAKKHGILTIVDNTFATPCFQQPLKLGVDIVWHSTTKYIGGHSDVIGGAVMTNNKEIKEKVDFARMALGLNPSPFDTWLINRGIKTLAVRMQKHQENAMAVAKFLEKHPSVKTVHYPGLPSHPQHQIAKKQMSGFGGVVTVDFNLSPEQTKKLLSSFDLFTLAESLGGVESLVNHPAIMTHASMPKEERLACGITDTLARFSVGIEAIEDLLADLNKIPQKKR